MQAPPEHAKSARLSGSRAAPLWTPPRATKLRATLDETTAAKSMIFKAQDQIGGLVRMLDAEGVRPVPTSITEIDAALARVRAELEHVDMLVRRQLWSVAE